MCRPSSGSSTGTSGSEGVGSGTITASVRALMPNHPACAEALALAKASLPPSILYHSFRVFLYAQAFMRVFQDDPEENLPSPHPAIFTTPLPGPAEPGKRSGGGVRNSPSVGSLRSPGTAPSHSRSYSYPRSPGINTSHPRSPGIGTFNLKSPGIGSGIGSGTCNSPPIPPARVSLSGTSATLVNNDDANQSGSEDDDDKNLLPLPSPGIPQYNLGLGISEPPPPSSPRLRPGIPNSAHAIPPFPEHILFVGCILHDIGTAPQYNSIPERFEIVGADVAVRVLRNHLPCGSGSGTPQDSPGKLNLKERRRATNTTILTTQALQSQQIKDLWLALSLHTSPGIAERMGGVVRAVRLAVRADFGSYPVPDLNFFRAAAHAEGGSAGASDLAAPGNGLVNVIKWGLPRLEIEKELGDAVVRQALGDRRKAPAASWPGDLVRAWEEDPRAEGVNKGF